MKTNFIRCLFLLAGMGIASPELKIAQGVWQAGGEISLPLQYDPVYSVQWNLNLKPDVAYFFSEHFFVSFSPRIILPLITPLIEQEYLWTIQWGAQIGVGYIGPRLLESVYPYVSLQAGALFHEADWYRTYYPVKLNPGVLFPINPYVALFIGMPIEVVLGGSQRAFQSLVWSPTLGLQAFL